MKTIIATVVVTLAALFLVLVGVAYSGIINIAASEPHLPGVEWFLEIVQDSSIEAHAGEVAADGGAAAPSLDDAERVLEGAVHYHEMCVVCHGAPGIEPSEIGLGLNPMPPDLAEEHESAEEYFWVVRNGIRMTGMPAFGVTHDDDTIWSIVAFVRQLPELDADAYAYKLRAAGVEVEAGGHGHEAGHGDGHEHPPNPQ